MAAYSITHACGHTQRHQIYGANMRGERERRAAELAGRPCTDCRHAEQARARQEVASAVVDLDGLPALTGSPRQVDWATSVRVAGIADIVTTVDRPPSGLMGKAVAAVVAGHPAPLFGPELDRAAPPARAAVRDLLVAAAVRQTRAGWWIDNRERIPWAVLDVLAEDEHSRLATLLGHPAIRDRKDST